MWIQLFASACLLWSRGSSQQPACHDIDTNACQLLQVSRPNLCQDAALASTACSRFCNLCPIECFSCSVVKDFTLCNTTQPCDQGEVCMLKTLKSFSDSHMEYHMTCETKEHCDGQGLTFPFGRRDIETRDVNVECCDKDFCNYPAITFPVTGTTQCNASKDVVVLVDQSAASTGSNVLSVITFLFHTIGPMDIGPGANLVGLYSYDVNVHKVFGLQDHLDSYSLKQALLRYRPSGNFTQQRTDGNSAVDFLVQHVLTSADGDRPDFADVVVIIADDSTAQNLHLSLTNQRNLGKLTHDVILVNVGGTGNSGQAAMGANHVLSVPSYDDLKTNLTMASSMYSLISAC